MGGRTRRRQVLAVVLVVLALVVSGAVWRLAGDVVDQADAGTFYDVPVPLPAGEAGSIIRSERLLGAPAGSVAWRVLYRSTDLAGRPLAVSGVVVSPAWPAPAEGRPVVSWAHPTTGAGRACAPSRMTDPFLLMAGLHELLRAGYVVAATDYSGMGADGPASYLIAATEAHNVLDAARAARAIPEAQAGTRLLLWGHSQGGQAALAAADLAPDYAPELHLAGAAVAAPAADLASLFRDHRDDVSGVTIGSYAFDALVRVYGPADPGVRLDAALTPAGAAVVPRIAPQCLLTDISGLHEIADPVVGRFFAIDPTAVQPWRSLLADNTPGPPARDVAVLVTQGLADELIPPAATRDLVSSFCSAGVQVTFREYAGIDHGLAGERTVPLLVPWFADVLAGRAPATSC